MSEVHKMDRTIMKAILKDVARSTCVMLLCVALIAPGILVLAEETPKEPVKTTTPSQQPTATTTAGTADDEKDVKAPPEKLESLVAPIALYPDELLAQVLVASTYPLELIQLHQWLQKHPELAKDQKKLTEAVAKQPWDPSIQAMAPLGDTVKWLAEDIQWVSDLGNAFLAQQQDVMDAVQRLRTQAKEKGVLKSGEQMAVKDETVEGKEIIVIQQANPEVVYVPSYNPYSVWVPGIPTIRGRGSIILHTIMAGRSRPVLSVSALGWRWCRLGRRLGMGLRMGRRRRLYQS